jgi:hypothetical protein
MYRKGLLWQMLALSVALVIGCGARGSIQERAGGNS